MGMRFYHKRQQRQVTSALDRCSKSTLMLGTCACPPPWPNLSTVGQKPPQRIYLFVIDLRGLVLTERTSFCSSSPKPTAIASSASSSASSSFCQRSLPPSASWLT